jgi:glycine cleavage system transcriptional repressor
MQKIVVSVLGYDRPGIIAGVSRILFEHGCNLEDVTQTILQTEFVGIFIATKPESVALADLLSSLEAKLGPLGLSAVVKPMQKVGEWTLPPSEPFVITTVGPDRPGLVAGITEVMARFSINITSLKAVFRGADDPHHNVMIYEVDIPLSIDQKAFRRELNDRAEELSLDLSLQHRDVFETIHRV